MPYNVIVGRNDIDKKKLGERGTIFIGKNYVKMGPTTSLSNNILLDIASPHVILISGKRGCLSGDTKIFTDHGFKDIGDFDEKNDRILSFDKKVKSFEWERAKLLKYPISNEKLIKINFKDGRSIITTKEHPLLLEYGKYLFWREASGIKEKDKIVSVIQVPEVKNDKESLRIARLLGFILADGTMNIKHGKFKDGRGYIYEGNKARLRIFDNCEEVLNTAKSDLEQEFNITAKRYKRKDCNCEVIETKHQKVINKFKGLGVPLGSKAGIIRVPGVVFESSNKFKSNFISALFCCDGYVPTDGRNIDYSSKSREFLLDLQLLFKHFGIESVIRKKMSKCNGKYFENYRLFITDNYSIKRFQCEIGFISKFKQERLMNHKFGDFSPRRRKTRYISEVLNCPKVKEIYEVEGITEVFDLQVPKNNSFIANGIISHNSGKSFSLGTIAEEMVKLPEEVSKNLAVLMFDTMGIFWTMKYPNLKQEKLLEKWDLKPEGLNINLFVPYGSFNDYKNRGIPVDNELSIKTAELSTSDWCSVFNISLTDGPGILIDQVISELLEKSADYGIDDIITLVRSNNKSDQKTKDLVESLFVVASNWGLFKKYGTKIEDLVKAGEVTVLDLSPYTNVSGNWSVKGLIIGLISKKLLNQRITSRKTEEIDAISSYDKYFEGEQTLEQPLVWLLLDEGHEFLPRTSSMPATDSLIQILREGRQPGISLIIATQQPGEIHKDVITQSDIIISHRLTSKIDLEALNQMMQTYLLSDINNFMNDLPKVKGSAILLDDNSERIYPIQIKPKRSWHGGDSPSAVKERKQLVI